MIPELEVLEASASIEEMDKENIQLKKEIAALKFDLDNQLSYTLGVSNSCAESLQKKDEEIVELRAERDTAIERAAKICDINPLLKGFILAGFIRNLKKRGMK